MFSSVQFVVIAWR